MIQVINHNLGYKIVHNPGYDVDLGYKNKSELFLSPRFLSGNKFKTWVIKNKIDFYNLGQIIT